MASGLGACKIRGGLRLQGLRLAKTEKLGGGNKIMGSMGLYRLVLGYIWMRG